MIKPCLSLAVISPEALTDDKKEVETDIEGHAPLKVTVSLTNLGFTVPCQRTKETKKILAEVNADFLPNQVAAIIGPSGCGKSTLLDAICGRCRPPGKISGTVEFNGKPAPWCENTSHSSNRDRSLTKRYISYVPQHDSLMGSLTVMETLQFSAALYSGASSIERHRDIDIVLDQMGLRSCANTKVGNVFFKGLSGGQQRRLSIGIELLAKSPALLLDEPTSGKILKPEENK